MSKKISILISYHMIPQFDYIPILSFFLKYKY